MTRYLPLAALLFVAALCVTSPGAAESVGGARVTLTLAGGSGKTRAFELVARELLARLAVELRVERVPRFDVRQIGSDGSSLRSSERVRVWLDFSDATRSTLYIHDLARDRVLVRKVDHADGMSEIAREELGHILQSSIEGLLAGAEIGLPRSEVLPSAPRQPVDRAAPAEPERGRPNWQISAHYEVELLSEEVLVTHGPLVALSLRGPMLGQELGIVVSAQYRQPLHATTNELGARLEGAALRALGTIDLGLSTDVGLRLGLGGGADLVEVRPEAQGEDSLELAEPKLVAVGVGRAVVGLEFRLSRSAALWTQFVCDIDPTATRYVFARSSGEHVVLYPFPVRPSLSLGLGFP